MYGCIFPGPYALGTDKQLLPSRRNGFQTILCNMIEGLQLKGNVFFTGKLSIQDMTERIRLANVFVNPSCMEVHAVSLREAMTEGVPCITSLCGSVSDFVQHGLNGYIYRFEEYEVLAYYINRLLDDSTLASDFSAQARDIMQHYGEDFDTLTEIYTDIILRGKGVPYD